MVQQQPRGGAAQLGRLRQRSPVPLQRHLHHFPVPPAQSQAAPATTLAPSIGGDAPHDAPQQLRQRVGMSLIPELLGRVAQMQREHLPLLLIGRPLAHQVDHALLQVRRLLETPP